MIAEFTYPLIVVGLIVLYILSSIKILREYERGVIFRLGRVLPQPKGPGIILVFAPIDRIVKISLRLITMAIPPGCHYEGQCHGEGQRRPLLQGHRSAQVRA